MPKEHKKRGRREDKKRKREHEDGETDVKIPKLTGGSEVEPPIQEEAAEHYRPQASSETPFYGLLNEHEQEYFSRANELLELNQFANPEERTLFLENVYREADGRELKIANSQSCSRLMERLILLSTPKQLKNLFQKFLGNFLHLVQHRFASHCCETLFIQAAAAVREDISATVEDPKQAADDEVYVSMENLYLYALNDLEGNMGFLMTDRFASHVLRVLLIVLSGQPMSSSSTTSLIQSKNKEGVSVAGLSKKEPEILPVRSVPESFHLAEEKMISEIVAGLDTNSLRALATHPTGSPVLQLLLGFELSTSGHERRKSSSPLLFKLLPDDPPEDGTESASFLNGLLYDPVGSHLLETIVRHAPGKTFKNLFRVLFKEKIGSLARNETAGYVVMRILERLSKEDLEETISLITPQIPKILALSRNGVMKTLIDRCQVRGANTAGIAESIKSVHGDGCSMLLKLLNLTDGDKSEAEQEAQSHATRNSIHLNGSLLAQSMLAVPGQLSEMVYDGLLKLPIETIARMAEDNTMSHVLQASLTLDTSSAQYRRKIIALLYGHLGRLAISPSGSHVLDALWQATQNLSHCRERVAEELLASEPELRDSYSGRIVWRNWMMDLYKRRKPEWIAKGKELEGTKSDQARTFKSETIKPISGIDAARQRFAAAKTVKRGSYKRSNGPNSIELRHSRQAVT
ncbi:MAG: Nucleolar protein 9 [Sclerophora amabilis]|nr:MAG: Nucleolar protein 9 [Sclerophora amabilis]